jgi:hypothetical protein
MLVFSVLPDFLSYLLPFLISSFPHFVVGNLNPPTQCLTTGEQVLATMDFDHHTTSYAVFGLGMLWLAYLVWLYLLLEFNRLGYTPLNFTGTRFKLYGAAMEANNNSNSNGNGNDMKHLEGKKKSSESIKEAIKSTAAAGQAKRGDYVSVVTEQPTTDENNVELVRIGHNSSDDGNVGNGEDGKENERVTSTI